MHAPDLRSGILNLSATLPPAQQPALLALAGLEREPAGARAGLDLGLRLLAAGLMGFGLLMWVAANWGAWSRSTHFLILQGAWVLTLLVAWRLPRARLAAGLLALLLQGGVLAYFGQTYQTGADPWQLFALWALLTLPLALQLRHDLLWAPWSLVLALGVTLWTHAHAGQRWMLGSEDLPLLMQASALLAAALAFLQWRGAAWGARALGLWSALLLMGWGLATLFDERVGSPYWMAGLLAGAGLLSQWQRADMVLLSVFALALNVWAVAGLSRLLFRGGGDHIGSLLLIGLVAAGLLAATVSQLMRLARRLEQKEVQP
ncbi:putative membrane protein [Inhella inkyongensis]|uniref:Putative membrane protein n=1 Tax=Inhella inkyongensis TaxID=392593 RepID=A0A840S878_9BURK|nr:DUF2157 domain-containing protein [Inhella inkyongensis]MBB5205822.1 putative membrane protein [Inhella inkyongensis]